MSSEPDWLRWAREIQAIAQNGLAFSPGVYDRERYVAAHVGRLVRPRRSG